MRIHRLFLIAGVIMIAVQFTGCGQNGSTGGGTNATPTNCTVILLQHQVNGGWQNIVEQSA